MPYEQADRLWPHFEPLWTDLRRVDPSLVLAGGYGLFLKQRWLATAQDVLILIPMAKWQMMAPRVTNDLDFVAELDLIASPGRQRQVDGILESHGFGVVERNARWQFCKELAGGQQVKVDFHTPPPADERDDLRWDDRRVKPHPSLKSTGIHGRANPEAVGCGLHPFRFPVHGLQVVVPNPVTWAIMKMVAMRDCHERSHDVNETQGRTEYWRGQATKHARDLCRILAMTCRDESDCARTVVAEMSRRGHFEGACTIAHGFFGATDGWGCQAARPEWRPEDLGTIRETLCHWFAPR